MVKTSMFSENSGILIRKLIWIILKKLKNALILLMFRLHMNLFEASKAGADYDLTTIFDDSLAQINPDRAVTFVRKP